MPQQPYQYIKLPDGSIGKFDSNATDADIKARIGKDFPDAYAKAPQTPAPAAAPSLPQRAYTTLNDPTPAAKALGVPAEEERLRKARDVAIAQGKPVAAFMNELQRADIDPVTGFTKLYSPIGLATATLGGVLGEAGTIGKAAMASIGGIFGYQGAKQAVAPRRPDENAIQYYSRVGGGAGQALLGGLGAGGYLGEEARGAVQREPSAPVPQLKPGAPPQEPIPATVQVPRTITVEAQPVSEPKSAVEQARANAEAMRSRVASGDITQEQYDVWHHTGKLRTPEELASKARVDAMMQGQTPPPVGASAAVTPEEGLDYLNPEVAAQKRVLEQNALKQAAATEVAAAKQRELEAPRALGTMIRAKLPETVPTEAPVETTKLEGSLADAQTGFEDAFTRANKARRATEPEKLTSAQTQVGRAFLALSRASRGQEEIAAQDIEKPIEELQSKIDYVKSHKENRASIIEIEKQANEMLATGREHKLGEPVRMRSTVSKEQVTPEGLTIMEAPVTGVSHNVREGLAALFGKRRVDVLGTLGRIPEENLSVEMRGARDRLAEFKELIASGTLSPEGLDTALAESKELEGNITKAFRAMTVKAQEAGEPLPAETKTHGHPTKQQVRDAMIARGLPVDELTETGAGKATTYKHGGTLPVMTQAIWENDFGGAKGKFGPAPELRPIGSKKGPFKPGEFEALETRKIKMLDEKQADLEKEIAQRKFFANALRKRAGERGFVGERGEIEPYQAQDMYEKLVDEMQAAMPKQDIPSIESMIPRMKDWSQAQIDQAKAFWPGAPIDDWIGRAKDIMQVYESRQIAGYSGPRLLAGLAGGMTTGALAGGAVAGLPGAMVGAVVGALAGSKLAASRWLAPGGPLDADLDILRAQAGATREASMDAVRRHLLPISDDLRVSDTMFTWKGAIDKADSHASQVMERFARWGRTMPKDDVVKLIDAAKTGNWQGLGQTQKDFIQLAQEKSDSNYAEMQRVLQERADLMGHDYNPSAFLENHFRVLYKNAGPKAPIAPKTLYGGRGYFKEHVFANLSDAVKAGFEPFTWDPVRMAELDWHDVHQFIYGMDLTKHMIEQYRNGSDLGAAFVQTGETPPPNFERVKGKPMEVYFHVPEGLVKAGEWFVHKDYARMLNNALSPDKIRRSAVGRLALGFRAAYGQWRLFGPFHVLAMNWAAASAEFGFGLRQLQMGVRGTDLPGIIKGLRDIAASPFAGREDYNLGKVARQADLAHLNPISPNFWDSPTGKLFDKNFPQGRELLEELWKGGGRNMFALQRELKDIIAENFEKHLIGAIDSFAQQRLLPTAGHALATLGTAPFATMRLATGWLFETYIPALKLGVAMRDLDLTFQENADKLGAGIITKTELARQVVRRTEDFFGQLNTDNFFINNSLKTGLMLSWRSFGWRFGTGDALWKGIMEGVGRENEGRGQSVMAMQQVQGGRALQTVNAVYEQAKQIPRIKPYSAYWLGYGFFTALASYAFYRAVLHRQPKTMHDLIEPELGGLDERGKPLRFGWPNYSGDVLRIAQNPFGLENNSVLNYATGGIADMWTAVQEARENKQWDGRFVIDPHEKNEYYRFVYKVGHALLPIDTGGPATFLTQNIDYWKRQGLSTGQALGLGLGLGGRMATRTADLSPAEQEMQKLTGLHYGSAPMTDAQFNAVQARHEITSAARSGRDWSTLALKYETDGTLTKNDTKDALRTAQFSYLENGIRNPQFSLEDTMAVFKKASPTEREEIRPEMARKARQFKNMRGDAQTRERIMSEYLDLMSQ